VCRVASGNDGLVGAALPTDARLQRPSERLLGRLRLGTGSHTYQTRRRRRHSHHNPEARRQAHARLARCSAGTQRRKAGRIVAFPTPTRRRSPSTAARRSTSGQSGITRRSRHEGAIKRRSVRTRSWNYLTVLVHDNEFDGITWHTCLRHLGGDTIKCGERLSDSLVLALNGALSSLVLPPRPDHAKLQGGLATSFLAMWRSLLSFVQTCPHLSQA